MGIRSIALAMSLLLACSSSRERPPEDGGAEDGAAPDSAVAGGAVATCRVARTTPVTGLARLDPLSPGPTTIPGGFVMQGGNETSRAAAFVHTDGRVAFVWSDLPDQVLPLGATPEAPRLVELVTLGEAGYDDVLWARPLTPEGAAGAEHELGPFYPRGTRVGGAATSWDGQRAVWVSGHVGIDPLHAFVIAPDGSRVGETVTLHDDLEVDPCVSVMGTAQGGAVAFKRGESNWELHELDARGQTSARYAWTDDAGGCATFRAAPWGWYATSRTGLRTLRAGRVDVLTDQTTATWAGALEDGSTLILRGDGSLAVSGILCTAPGGRHERNRPCKESPPRIAQRPRSRKG